LVERFVYTEDVGGSSPSSPTIQRADSRRFPDTRITQGCLPKNGEAEPSGSPRPECRIMDDNHFLAIEEVLGTYPLNSA
jgi:hypothetical protein